MDISSTKIYAPDMPMGLDIALTKNPTAKAYFYSLPESAQARIIEHTHIVQSKEEMQAFADSLVRTGTMR